MTKNQHKPLLIVLVTALAVGLYLTFRKPKQTDQDKIYWDAIDRMLSTHQLLSGVGKKDHDETLMVEVDNGNLSLSDAKKLISGTRNIDSNLLYWYFMFLRDRYGYVN